MKGIVIAGTHSGCGKTTAALGLMAALRGKGLSVQPFKTGPDFIDAGLHRLAAGQPSRNLDVWMCGREYVLDSFHRHAAGADIAVVEGVMGLYDGECSTASLAGLLRAPVLLVVDAYGMAESAGAMVHGFAGFGVRSSEFKNLKFIGVVFNRVASENHYKRLKDSVRDVPVLGRLPRDLDFEIPHRHLGLTVAEEDPISRRNIDKLAGSILQYIDIDSIIRGAELPEHESFYREGAKDRAETGKFRVAVALDKAFCFYYEDNLDLLRNAGAEIIPFSPLADHAVPEEADAVYIGGGYPELHAEALSQNVSMRASIRSWAGAGKPLYAECGGLMYLSKGLRDFSGHFFSMADVFPFECAMTKKPRLGYREIVLNDDCILGAKGEKVRGHEFHYSEIDGMRNEGERNLMYSVRDGRGQRRGEEGFRYKNTLASYVHVHFGSARSLAGHFADFIKGVTIG